MRTRKVKQSIDTRIFDKLREIHGNNHHKVHLRYKTIQFRCEMSAVR